MSSYFIGFAFGVLFWGSLSDRIGRRPAMLRGILVYLLGNLGLLIAPTFNLLLIARVIQAFGAATGSVVTQTIMRESFHAVRGEKVFAQVSAAMALSPALGPLIGGSLLTSFGNYQSVFIALIGMSVILFIVTLQFLPETINFVSKKNETAWYQVAKRMLMSPQVINFCMMIAGINGILFSYYAEAPFVFEQFFGLSAAQYGWLGMIVAIASIVGATVANFLSGKIAPNTIADFGLMIALIGAFSLLLVATQFIPTLIVVFVIFSGINISLPIALNRALIGFEDVMGMASGLLSFVYYLIISGFTFLMSIMHNGTVHALPQYICLILFIMISVRIITRNRTSEIVD